MLRFNSTASVQEPIRAFLYNYQIMSDDFWSQYKRSSSYEDVLECYYQFSKNQCTIIETLLENLRMTKNYEHIKEEMKVILKDGFTF